MTLVFEWNWPRRTSSYELEVQGYSMLQAQVRYTDTGPKFPRLDHAFMRRVHHAGRTGRFA